MTIVPTGGAGAKPDPRQQVAVGIAKATVRCPGKAKAMATNSVTWWTSILLRFGLVAAVVLTGCAKMVALERDLAESAESFAQLAGTLKSDTCPDCAVTIVMLDKEGRVLGHRIFERPGSFALILNTSATSVLAFHDRNRNLRFDFDEPYAWRRLTAAENASRRLENVLLDIRRGSGVALPGAVRSAEIMDLRKNHEAGIDIQLGRVMNLADTRFDATSAELGMWQPLRFLKNGLAGIYFLEPYDANRVPVLFVHGINGTPRDLTALAAGLDRRKYQAWFYFYPSGLEIQTNAIGLLGALNKIWFEHRFRDLEIVAHSMGGLVARAYLNTCHRERECDFVGTFISISSPFGGDSAAQAGVEYAPVVMPVWRSMAPNGPLVDELLSQPMPKRVKYHLIFGYRNSSILSRKSGDGTVPLDSQLRLAAQIQAKSTRGFDEDHMGILASAHVSEHVNDILAREAFFGN